MKAGRYGSASEVVREGLRLVEEREAKLTALRAIIDASITAGGQVSDEQLDDALAHQSNALLRQGIGREARGFPRLGSGRSGQDSELYRPHER